MNKNGCALYFSAEGAVMGLISYIKEEIEVIRERDPAIKSNMEEIGRAHV